MIQKIFIAILAIFIIIFSYITLIDTDAKPNLNYNGVEVGRLIDVKQVENNSSTDIISLIETSKIKSKKHVTLSHDISIPIFDATLYKNKNSKNEKIFVPIKILYHHISLFRSKENIIDLEYLRDVAKKLPKSTVPYILNIEIWNVHTTNDIEANKNIDKYILVINTMKKARPDLKFGYYGVLPNRDYWSPVLNNPQKIQEWNHINNRLKRLAEHVDVICPSLYMFYDDLAGWKKYAIENIKRSREYGKPVYPFLWPQYHNSNKLLKLQFINSQLWREQLEFIEKEVDGIIIWGGYNLSKENYGKMEWDEKAPWWQATKKFITGIGKTNYFLKN